MNTISSLLEAGADEAVALVAADGVALDYVTLRRRVHRLADQLREAGIGADDRVAIVLPNGPEMAMVFLATCLVGCAAPLNPAYREDEFRYYLNDLGVKALITEEGEMAAAAHAALPVGTSTITVSGRFPSLDLRASQDSPQVDNEPTGETVALVLHTSGTTSRPKIVPLRQRNLVGSARNVAASLRLNQQDRSLNVMPLFHIHGLVAGLLAPLSAGASVVCTPGFEPFAFHGWLEAHQPSYYSAVPSMHQAVLVMARSQGRPTPLRLVRSSSASLPGPVLENLKNLFGVPVIEAYGMTEAAHQMASNPLPPEVAKPGSVGRPTGLDIAVLDKAGRSLPSGERGEVGIKGATVFDGYENNPDANNASFTAGWFRTGDEGFLDEDGYLFLTGRLKEQINRGGEKISPLEIDEVLLRNPAVAQAVTFAIPHQTLGEEVGAAVVLASDQQATAEELQSYMTERVAPFKVPKTVVFVEEIPKGATGKIQRIGLAQRLGLTE